MGSVTCMCILYIYLEICTYVRKTMTREAINLKENKESYMGEFGEKEGKGEIKQLYYILKNERTNKT